MKSFYLILAIVVIFVGFIGAAVYFKGKSSTSEPIPGIEVTADDHVRGNGPITLVEYSDFQCPACRAYYPIVEELLKQRGEKITFVYRYFPLPQHFNAYPSAQAAEAAGKQGKFFEMGDKLFTNQDAWANFSASAAFEVFKGYAAELGLDITKFESDYKDSLTKGIIQNGYKSGVKLGVDQTPTFFLNGKRLKPGPQSLDEFIKLIDEGSTPTPAAPINVDNTQL